MPSITIRERDLTSPGNLDDTTNAVYIPGYSNMGPTNTPIACETLEDFQLIFGSEPYKIRSTQAWPVSGDITTGVGEGSKGFSSNAVKSTMGNFYERGEFEKSYIMATELLKLGIPVLYERIFDDSDFKLYIATDGNPYSSKTHELKEVEVPLEDDKKEWQTKIFAKGENGVKVGDYSHTESAWVAYTYNNDGVTAADSLLKIEAISPGVVSKNIYYTLVKNSKVKLGKDLSGNVKTGTYYTIKVGRNKDTEFGISDISPISTKFTFDSEVAALYSDCKMVYGGQTIEDNSGLVKLIFDPRVNKDTPFTEVTTALNLKFKNENAIKTNGIYKDEFTVNSMYAKLMETGTDTDTGEHKGLNRLLDKGEYVIKFITSGAYPVFEFDDNSIAQKMIELAANRGDCTALIDHTPENERESLALKTNSV